MAAARILMGFLCLAFIGRGGKPDGHLLGAEDQTPAQILTTARKEIGVRELSGKNDGTAVVRYLKSSGLHIGDPWCAAFISWVYQQNGYAEPRTGWCPAMFPKSRSQPAVPDYAMPANVFGIYILSKKRVAHVGLVESYKDGWVTSIEGNTNSAGSNEGDGVYRKIRHIKTLHCFADWIRKEKKK